MSYWSYVIAVFLIIISLSFVAFISAKILGGNTF